MSDLVVEDQMDNRQILRDLLGSAGYPKRKMGKKPSQQSPSSNLILMDIQLPVLDGTRQHDGSGPIPI
jgi:two-component system, cell cycle response regulator DivK